jgi:hypothetical protein
MFEATPYIDEGARIECVQHLPTCQREEIMRLTVITVEMAYANVMYVVACQNVMFLN